MQYVLYIYERPRPIIVEAARFRYEDNTVYFRDATDQTIAVFNNVVGVYVKGVVTDSPAEKPAEIISTGGTVETI